MRQAWMVTGAAVALALAGCSERDERAAEGQAVEDAVRGNALSPDPLPSPDLSPTPTAGAGTAGAGTAAATDVDYLGRWTGVEGMYLVVTSQPQGGVELEMQYDLDNRVTVPGSVTGEGLRFVRNGEAEIAKPTDGDATGLKYLAGKTDCLTVKPGEGYCRG